MAIRGFVKIGDSIAGAVDAASGREQELVVGSLHRGHDRAGQGGGRPRHRNGVDR